MKKLISSLFSILLLFACTRSVPLDSYSSQDYSKPIGYTGSVNIGNFAYVPYEQGRLASNQISNTRIYLPTDIADLAQQATLVELQRNGFQLGNAKFTLSGKVKNLALNSGSSTGMFTMKINYTINYQLLNTENNTIILNRDYSASKYTNIVSDYEIAETINKLFHAGYDKFINDYDVRKILERK